MHHKTMDNSVPPLIRALLDPHRYPGAVQQVELVQTPISWILLAGEFAYKIKKPLQLHFLDFSTLEKRRACCSEELRLNQRFAADIYLDVLSIFNTPDDPHWIGIGAPIEYAVKMKRFPADNRLDRVCSRGELQPSHLSDLADTLYNFQNQSAIAPGVSNFGSPTTFATMFRDNFDSLRRSLAQHENLVRLQTLQSWCEAQFAQLSRFLVERKEAGWVRECHGDLHLANLVLIDHRVRMFDCIEFNAELRWIDQASEIAFTYMDLLAHQRPDLANWFIDEMLSRNGDYGAIRILRLCAVYRALVRAMVEASPTQGSHIVSTRTLIYVALAERLTAPRPGRLIITHGPSGCGKTLASSALLLRDPLACTVRLRSDVERKRLHGLSASARSGSQPDAGLYTAQATNQTYARLRNLVEMLLPVGGTVIVDASFLKRTDRDTFHALALEAGATFEILAPQATAEQLTERIQSRQAEGKDASDATLEVLAQQMRTMDPLGSDELQWLVPPKRFQTSSVTKTGFPTQQNTDGPGCAGSNVSEGRTAGTNRAVSLPLPSPPDPRLSPNPSQSRVTLSRGSARSAE